MSAKPNNQLIRALGLGSLIIYGVGDILGAGIYALVGKIAGYAGALTWVSFALAMAIVLLTALTYSELGSRVPKSGGVSVYMHEAFGHRWLSMFTGLLLFSATIFSMSTLSQAFIGYLRTMGFYFPDWLGIFGFLIILLLINIRGIKHSSIANIISTVIEISGLIILLVCGYWYLSQPNIHPIVTPKENMPGIMDIFKGAALAFFAFTGFEDLSNVAEEVESPEKNLPRAILSSLSIAGLLYLAVSWMSTAIIPVSELSGSESPLLTVVHKSYPALPSSIFAIIAMFSISNTTLLNYVTASRLLYGMSKTNLLPEFLQMVHAKYHTPYIAILITFPIVLGLGLVGNLRDLASTTSVIVLTIFSFSSIALIKIKLKKNDDHNTKIFRVPLFVPCLAVILNICAISCLPPKSIMTAAIFTFVGLIVMWTVMKDSALKDR